MPLKVGGSLEVEKVVKISCGEYHFIALTLSGKVICHVYVLFVASVSLAVGTDIIFPFPRLNGTFLPQDRHVNMPNLTC